MSFWDTISSVITAPQRAIQHTAINAYHAVSGAVNTISSQISHPANTTSKTTSQPAQQNTTAANSLSSYSPHNTTAIAYGGSGASWSPGVVGTNPYAPGSAVEVTSRPLNSSDISRLMQQESSNKYPPGTILTGTPVGYSGTEGFFAQPENKKWKGPEGSNTAWLIQATPEGTEPGPLSPYQVRNTVISKTISSPEPTKYVPTIPNPVTESPSNPSVPVSNNYAPKTYVPNPSTNLDAQGYSPGSSSPSNPTPAGGDSQTELTNPDNSMGFFSDFLHDLLNKPNEQQGGSSPTAEDLANGGFFAPPGGEGGGGSNSDVLGGDSTANVKGSLSWVWYAVIGVIGLIAIYVLFGKSQPVKKFERRIRRGTI